MAKGSICVNESVDSRLQRVEKGVSPQLTSDALVRVLAKSPADRFLSYDEFGMALEAARSQWLIQKYSQSAQAKATKSKTSWWRR